MDKSILVKQWEGKGHKKRPNRHWRRACEIARLLKSNPEAVCTELGSVFLANDGLFGCNATPKYIPQWEIDKAIARRERRLMNPLWRYYSQSA